MDLNRCKEENKEVRGFFFLGFTLLGAKGLGVQLAAKRKGRRHFRLKRQSQEMKQRG